MGFIIATVVGPGVIWGHAEPLLRVRDNDAHTLYALSLAASLLDTRQGPGPGPEASIVLPAIMLHDIGWSAVDPDEVLSTIAPGADRKSAALGNSVSHQSKPGSVPRTSCTGCPSRRLPRVQQRKRAPKRLLNCR